MGPSIRDCQPEDASLSRHSTAASRLAASPLRRRASRPSGAAPVGWNSDAEPRRPPVLPQLSRAVPYRHPATLRRAKLRCRALSPSCAAPALRTSGAVARCLPTPAWHLRCPRVLPYCAWRWQSRRARTARPGERPRCGGARPGRVPTAAACDRGELTRPGARPRCSGARPGRVLMATARDRAKLAWPGARHCGGNTRPRRIPMATRRDRGELVRRQRVCDGGVSARRRG